MDVEITSQDVRARVEPVVDLVRSALEEGKAKVEPVRKLLKVGPDAWFDAHVARRYARSRIEATARVSEQRQWSVGESVPNSGIHLVVPRADVRVRRGRVDRIPAPGGSLAQRAFYRQERPDWGIQGYFDFSSFVPQIVTDRLNILILWNDLADGSISLVAVVPADAWKFGGSNRILAYARLDEEFDDLEFIGDDDPGWDLVYRIEDELDDDEDSGGDVT